MCWCLRRDLYELLHLGGIPLQLPLVDPLVLLRPPVYTCRPILRRVVLHLEPDQDVEHLAVVMDLLRSGLQHCYRLGAQKTLG